jgi:hypothetical protein
MLPWNAGAVDCAFTTGAPASTPPAIPAPPDPGLDPDPGLVEVQAARAAARAAVVASSARDRFIESCLVP